MTGTYAPGLDDNLNVELCKIVIGDSPERKEFTKGNIYEAEPGNTPMDSHGAQGADSDYSEPNLHIDNTTKPLGGFARIYIS